MCKRSRRIESVANNGEIAMNEPLASLHVADSSHKRRWALGALIAATSASVALSLSAWAGNEGASPAGPPMGMMRDGAGPGMDGLPFGGAHLKRLLDDVKASDAQRLKIKQLVDKAQADLKALHEEGRSLREQGLKLWAAPKLDAGATEKLRLQMLGHHDRVSKRMMQLMLDVGQVLTPEQRADIARQVGKQHEDMMHRMQEHRAERHRGDKMAPDAAPQPSPQER